MKNKNGFTLVEIIVALLISAIVMGIATTLILNSMGYFAKITVSDNDKQILDGINNFVSDQLRYASEVKVDVNKPDKTEWNWLYWKEGKLYKNKNQDEADDYSVYNDDFYNKKLFTIKIRGFDSYRMDLKFTLKDSNNVIVYKTSTTLELLNLKVRKTQNEKFDPFSNISTEFDLSGDQKTYKIYYKNGEIPLENNGSDLDGDGTVADEIDCMDKTVTKPGEAGNNKGEYVEGATYYKGDFVQFNGSWYRASITLTFPPGKTWEWKKIDKNYDADSNGSKYSYGDIVIYNEQYWQVIGLYGSGGHAPSATANSVWAGGFASVEEAINNKKITPAYANQCVLETNNYIGIVANKDDRLTSIPNYDDESGLGHDSLFVRYDNAVWLKITQGAGSVAPGEKEPGNSEDKGYAWQKIQIDWDATSAYIKGDIIRYNQTFYRLVIDKVIKGQYPTNTAFWEKVVYKGNGVWEISK